MSCNKSLLELPVQQYAAWVSRKASCILGHPDRIMHTRSRLPSESTPSAGAAPVVRNSSPTTMDRRHERGKDGILLAFMERDSDICATMRYYSDCLHKQCVRRPGRHRRFGQEGCGTGLETGGYAWWICPLLYGARARALASTAASRSLSWTAGSLSGTPRIGMGRCSCLHCTSGRRSSETRGTESSTSSTDTSPLQPKPDPDRPALGAGSLYVRG